jgi:hypothetical protein
MISRRLIIALSLIVITAWSGCRPVTPTLTDTQLAEALAESIRLNHEYRKTADPEDSVRVAWSAWLNQNGIDKQQLEKALDERETNPESWGEILRLLEARKDSLFPDIPKPAQND